MMNTLLKNIILGTVYRAGKIIVPRKQNKLQSREDVRTILIASLHGLGDVFYASSVFPLLKERFRSSNIDVWVHSRSAEVLKHNPFIQKQYVYDEIVTRRDAEHFHLDWNNRMKFIANLRDVHYDLIFDFSWVWGATIMLKAAKPEYFAGSSQHGLGFLFDSEYPYESIRHLPLIELYGDILKGIGIVRENAMQPRPVFYMSDHSISDTEIFLQKHGIISDNKYITFHTTAGWREKEWGVEKYASLANMLQSNNGYNIVVIGNGKRDHDNIMKLRNLYPGIINALNIPLDLTAGILSRSSCHVGGDSFPMHLAAALKIPTVCIAGPTNPLLFAPPIATNVKIIYRELSCSAAAEDRYCTRNAGRICPTIECLTAISVPEIFSVVRDAVKA